jgi:outer membrane usher protein
VEGEPKIPIYLENQLVAHTNQRGRAVVSPLRAYQENTISIDPLELRLDTTVSSVKKTVVPRSQGGVRVDFEAHQVRSVTLTLLLPNGTVLPPWTPVQVAGVVKPFVTGLRGETFVELPQRNGNRVRAVVSDGSRCELIVDVPATAPNLSFLEPMTCVPVH